MVINMKTKEKIKIMKSLGEKIKTDVGKLNALISIFKKK